MDTHSRSVYRQSHNAPDLTFYHVKTRETDLHVATKTVRRSEAEHALLLARAPLEAYIAAHPGFLTSLTPLEAEPGAPECVRRMAAAGKAAGVGPMAAVAGAIAQLVGEALCQNDDVIVENGGDLFIHSQKSRRISVYAGPSPLSEKMAVELPPGSYGVATSAGTFGHSLSFGHADAAMVVSHDAALADAAATALGNRLQTAADIEPSLSHIMGVSGVLGALCIVEGAFGAVGVRLVPLS